LLAFGILVCATPHTPGCNNLPHTVVRRAHTHWDAPRFRGTPFHAVVVVDAYPHSEPGSWTVGHSNVVLFQRVALPRFSWQASPTFVAVDPVTYTPPTQPTYTLGHIQTPMPCPHSLFHGWMGWVHAHLTALVPLYILKQTWCSTDPSVPPVYNIYCVWIFNILGIPSQLPLPLGQAHYLGPRRWTVMSNAPQVCLLGFSPLPLPLLFLGLHALVV